MQREKKPKHEFDSLIGVYSVLLLVFMFFLALKNDTSIILVIYGFLPTIAYLILNYIFLYRLRQKRLIVWIMPFLLVLLFHGMAELVSQSTIARMDLTVVSYLNLLVSYVFAAITMFYIYVISEIEKEKSKLAHIQEEVKVVEKREEKNKYGIESLDIRTTIQGIEDKCKALNFAIGRVYSNKHGGNPELRSRIRINKEWYNTFSKLIESFTDEDKRNIKKSVSLILNQLNKLEKRESDVFPKTNFKGITRDDQGRDRIIDVLVRNDKDPVETYVNSAKDFCKHILDVLSKEKKPVREQLRTMKVDPAGSLAQKRV